MKKGFTLIELLIVIAILAILTTTVVLVLNPAEMLKKARDSQRMADLDSVRTAISLYLATASSPTIGLGPFYQGPIGGTVLCMALTGTCTGKGDILAYSVTASTTNWIGIDLSGTSGGSPLSVLPRDPSNTTALHYAYKGNASMLFALNAILESNDNIKIMQNDGGASSTVYEIGTAPGLLP